MDISKIKPYEKNAKVHPKKQIEQVANSIKEFGFNQPIVLDKNNVIIVGHGRYEAAKLLGLDDVPTITVDLTEEQAKAYRLADNKLNESEWDMKLAVDELKELSEEMQGLTGFDLDLLIEPDEKDDEIPEDAPPVAKLGDLWALGRHRLLCGDATKIEDVERLMDGKKADMVFTDPPYGVQYKTIRDSGLEKIKNDELTGENLKVFNFSWMKIMHDFSKSGAEKFICCDWRNLGEFIKPLEEAGEVIGTTIVWNKKSSSHNFIHWIPVYEMIIFCGSQKKKDKECQYNVWEVKREFRDDHPTPKPVELITKPIIRDSKEEDIILDLFGGSGSTLIACEKTNRICYMSELDPKYVSVILQRWADYTGQDPVREDGVKWSEICNGKTKTKFNTRTIKNKVSNVGKEVEG
jgi:DNA modification methylase